MEAAPAATAARPRATFKGPLWKNRPTVDEEKWKAAEEQHKKDYPKVCWFYMTHKDGCRHAAGECRFEHFTQPAESHISPGFRIPA
eukprot:5169890-Prymnesium_polylepis.1